MQPLDYEESVKKFNEVSKIALPKLTLFKIISRKYKIPLLKKDWRGREHYNMRIYKKLKPYEVWLYTGESDWDWYYKRKFRLYEWFYYF